LRNKKDLLNKKPKIAVCSKISEKKGKYTSGLAVSAGYSGKVEKAEEK